MAIGIVSIASGVSNVAVADGTYPTASVTPSAWSVAIAIVSVRSTGGASSVPEPTITGGGLTWSTITSIGATTGTGRTRLAAYWGVAASPAASPITFSAGTITSGIKWMVAECSSVSTGSPIVQSAITAPTTSLSQCTVFLSSFASTANIAVGGFGLANLRLMTPKVGWTQLSNHTTVIAPGMASAYTSANTTLFDYTVDLAASGWVGLAFELANQDAAAAAATGTPLTRSLTVRTPLVSV